MRSYLFQTGEYFLFVLEGDFVHFVHIDKIINPTFKEILTILLAFQKAGQLDVDLPELAVEHLAGVPVYQHHVTTEMVRLFAVEEEIGEKHTVHGHQLVIPLRRPYALANNRFRHVEQGPVLKMFLPAVLHLDDDMLPGFGLAEDIVNNFPHPDLFGQPFVVEVADVGDHVLAFEKAVQKID